MSQREKIIGMVMLGMILFWGILKVTDNAAKTPLAVPTEQSSVNEMIGVLEVKQDLSPKVEFLIDQIRWKQRDIEQEALNDPFAKLDPKKDEDAEPDISDLVLFGISYGEDNDEPLVLINDEVLNVGDTILGFKLEKVTPNEVLMTKGLEKYILKLSVEGKE